MARKSQSPLSLLESVLADLKAQEAQPKEAKAAREPKQPQVDVKKALSLFRKSHNLLSEAIAVLESQTESKSTRAAKEEREVDPEAPFGRKADGTPAKPRGRKKANG
ncbi:hypothetical protein HER32_17520 [Hymenobacter sp. BT18]|uniref:hypothetical protein n=1 Tax=Hymenobacter sp. BT18 TaxID=2835648 RepID=UPI00143E3EE7|nr:hypothetical protein [Hymenobacter sp. BT18]QIX62875.1 hypothetical protein HER32_17520 [Hymenobacter sp. BT18]